MTPLWLHKASHLFACVIEVIRSDITVYHLRAQVMITNNVSLVARLVTGFVLFSCCLADLGRLNGRAVCEVICDKMRHMLSHLYKPAAAQLFLFEYFTFMWVELGCIASHHEIWIQTARKWAPAWKRGVLNHKQPYQVELPCLPSVKFPFSSQLYHLGAAVGDPLTEHLQQQGPHSSCRGCPFYHSSHLFCWGSTSWKAVVTAPHLRQHHHLHRRYCCNCIYPCSHFHSCIQQKTCDSNLELHISLISNHVASISRSMCCLGSKQKQYESLI